MVAIAVQFLNGRYHATIWGHHVNEGLPEWPPSPWRLLRALVATWKRTLPQLPDDQVARILVALTGPPLFHLPDAMVGHTRHYMPWFKKGPDDRTLVFDTFAATLSSEPVVFHWPEAVLDEGDRATLSALLANLGYLGRAETWCEARLCDAPVANCVPLPQSGQSQADVDIVPVLIAETAAPEVVLTALLVETGDLRGRQRRIDPPGSLWMRYGRPRTSLRSGVAPSPPSYDVTPVHAIRFQLDARPLPSLLRTVCLGETARDRILQAYNEDRPAPSVLTGRDAEGPLRDGHRHAFYLASDDDLDGHIDHFTVWAPAGLDGEAQRAVAAALDKLPLADGREARLVLLGTSSEVAQGAAYTVWESLTPFVPTRHLRRKQSGSGHADRNGIALAGPEGQVWLEWARRQAVDPALPDLEKVEVLDRCTLHGGRTLHWLDFHPRWLRCGGPPPANVALGFRLAFAAPVAGPVALGYGCHYGLGQFRPATLYQPSTDG